MGLRFNFKIHTAIGMQQQRQHGITASNIAERQRFVKVSFILVQFIPAVMVMMIVSKYDRFWTKHRLKGVTL